MKKVKMAYIGGGSMFVPSVLNGVHLIQQKSEEAYRVEVALYDIDINKTERMVQYGAVLSAHSGGMLDVKNVSCREEALEAADIVFLSVSLPGPVSEAYQIQEAAGIRHEEDGLFVFGEALAVAPFHFEIARQMRELANDSLLISLVNPTDVLAGALRKGAGLKTAGLCVEIDGLKGALAHYFGVPADGIQMTHGGVNHDGWVLSLKVGERDVYTQWRDDIRRLAQQPHFHPGNLSLPAISHLTGYFKSSGYHLWPFSMEFRGTEEAWKLWGHKRERYEEALNQAIQEKKPITDPEGIHPEESLVNYPLTGITIGQLLESIAVGKEHTIPLQVMNNGALDGFPSDSVVEVPTIINGKDITPRKLHGFPEWLGGYTRLLALQRGLLADYLCNPELDTLMHALSVLPMLTDVEKLARYGEELHKHFEERIRKSRSW